MQEKLIIYLHAEDLSQPGWAVMDKNGQIQQSIYRDNPDGLATLAQQKEVIVIVPSEDVMLTETTLPKMSRSRLMEVIPFALEEQLIEDVENLHFSISEINADGKVSVAIVARNKMQQWQALIKAWNIQANSIVPACLALAFSPDKWHIAITDKAIVRIGETAGFACELTNLNAYLNGALTQTNLVPQEIIIHKYVSQDISFLTVPVSLQDQSSSSDQLIEDMAKQVGNKIQLDLLQGTYSVKKARFTQLNNMGKAITYLVFTFLILLFLYPTGSYLILQKRDSDLKNQMGQIYHQHFPQNKTMIAPKIRLEDKLHALQGEASENKLLLLLGFVSKGITQTNGIQLKRFDFQNGQLTLELNAASSQNFSALSSFLTQQGLQVKQQNAVLSGEKINATLQIE